MSAAGLRPVALAALLAAAALCHADPDPATAYEPAPGVLGPRPGVYAAAQVLVPATLSAGSRSAYRFAGQEAWQPFDRPLYLSAFPGEERRYSIEFADPRSGPPSSLTYTIDLRPPEPPTFSAPPGDAGSYLSVSIASDCDAFVSVDGGPFEPSTAGSPLEFHAPADATAVVSIAAYSVDAVGNASGVASSRWRLCPDGVEPSFPFDAPATVRAVAKADAGAYLSAEVADLVGSARLTVRAPAGTVPCVAVNPADASSPASFVELSGGSSSASCVVPFPWGYEIPIDIRYGYVDDGVVYVATDSLRLLPRFPAEEASMAPAEASAPEIRAYGSAAFVHWPVGPWAVVYSIGDGDFVQSREPLRVALGAEPIPIRYYAVGPDGARSAVSTATLPPGASSAPPAIVGVKHGGAYGGPVIVVPGGASRPRYELSDDGSAPPPVDESSPSLPAAGLAVEGRPGETVSYRLRVADGPEAERFVSFTIDREAPAVPAIAQSLSGYAAADTVVSFREQEGEVYVSISEDGAGPFERYVAPIAMAGSDEGRKRYVVRAYAEDEFGNRSDEMPPFGLMIDRSTLYVDARGRPGASGAPDDPMPGLDDAIEAAQRAGKRFVYVRGSSSIGRAVVVGGRLEVRGGFDERWNEAPSINADVSVRVPPTSSSYAFVVDGGELALSSISFSLKADGAGGLVLARSGSLEVDRCSISATGGIEVSAVRSTGADVTVSSSILRASSVVTGRGIDLSGGRLVVSDSTIGCDRSVRLFDAIRVSDAEAVVSGLRIDAEPSHAFSAFSASRSTASIERCIVSVSGGSSSCRAFSAVSSELTASSVYVRAAWKGSVELFSAGSASTMRLAHVTAIADAPAALFVSSSASTVDVANSIASFSGGASVFMRVDGAAGSVRLASNCLWGFERLAELSSPRRTIASVDELNGAFGSGRAPNRIERPSDTFRSTVKGLYRLSPASACAGGGRAVPWAAGTDLFGTPRPTGDGATVSIGAEEL
ncbi:MAG TPA: hypothetical protein P5298_00350 [Spirochaetia bacterium]|nr:hypothetical protein [Spirochaetia bacterium]